MRTPPPLTCEFKSALHDKLLPWSRSGQIQMMVAQPPFKAVGGVTVVTGKKPLLKNAKTKSTGTRVYYWPECGLNATNEIYFGCVLEGEADIRIGVTERMAARDKRLRNGPGYYVLQLPSKVFFLVPPGVPVSDGLNSHWERPDIGSAASLILWITVRTQGILLHTCRTAGSTHVSSGAVLVADPHLQALAEMLSEELRNDMQYSPEISRCLLQTLLLRTVQSYAANSAILPAEVLVPQLAASQPSHAPTTGTNYQAEIVQRTCRYIRTYQQNSLTLDQIAAHSFVSTTHLSRLFRAELNTSVMKYVTKCRVEAAQSLLIETNMPAREISQLVGFSHPSHLSQVFAREVGISPTDFRNTRRANRPTSK